MGNAGSLGFISSNEGQNNLRKTRGTVTDFKQSSTSFQLVLQAFWHQLKVLNLYAAIVKRGELTSPLITF